MFLLKHSKDIIFLNFAWINSKSLSCSIRSNSSEKKVKHENAINEEPPEPTDKLRKSHKLNFSNPDECKLFYGMAPGNTIVEKLFIGKTMLKDCLTILVCCISDKSIKYHLMFIEHHATRPRTFQNKKNGSKFGLCYRHDRKAWKISVLFLEWLTQFDAYIAQSPGYMVSLLIENCSAHGATKSLPLLVQTHIVFFMPLCTSPILTCDTIYLGATHLF